MDFAHYKALSFDCYGTLIDWETGLLAALRPWLTRVGSELAADQTLEAYARAESAVEHEHPTWAYPDILREVVNRLCADLAVTATAADRDHLANSVGDWPAFADSSAALADLATRYQLAILSNVDRESFARSKARLGVSFDLVVTAQDVGSYKPNLANFHHLLAALAERGIERHQVLHVAQSLHHDIEPARELGLSCVWIDRRSSTSGFGATMPPIGGVQADATFPTMAAFADQAR